MEDPSRRSAYRLMFAPVFGPFFWGVAMSYTGIWIHSIVAVIVAYELTGSSTVAGLVTAAQFTPQLLLAPLSGKRADRGKAALQIVTGRMLAAVGSSGLAVWIFAVGGLDGLPGVAPVLASSFVLGVGLTVAGPATQSVIPSLIRPGEMAAAATVSVVPMTVARVAGPGIGALIATQLGAGEAFAIAAGGNVAHAMVVLVLRLPRQVIPGAADDVSVRASLAHVRADRPLAVLLMGMAAIGFGAEPSLTLAPAIAHDLGTGNAYVGQITSAFGVGAGAGFLLFAPLHRRWSLANLGSWGLIIMALSLVIAATAQTQAMTLAAFGLSGLGMTLAFVSITTQIQNRAPDALRGRIMAFWLVAFLGTRPFSSATAGFLADVASIDVALVACAAVVTGAVVLGWPRDGRAQTRPDDRSS
jgi:MFS family permease